MGVKWDLQCPENVPAELLMVGVSPEQQGTAGAVGGSSSGWTSQNLQSSLESGERGLEVMGKSRHGRSGLARAGLRV